MSAQNAADFTAREARIRESLFYTFHNWTEELTEEEQRWRFADAFIDALREKKQMGDD